MYLSIKFANTNTLVLSRLARKIGLKRGFDTLVKRGCEFR